LHFSAEFGRGSGGAFVEGVAVGVAEDEEVDVPDRAGSSLLVVPGGPGEVLAGPALAQGPVMRCRAASVIAG
jgi:hypothetical protein